MVPMYVETVPNRNSPPAILLRESFREDGQVRKRTLANISDWPAEQIESLRRVLKGETFPSDGGSLDIRRSLPHGHVAAVVGTMRKLGFPQLIDTERSAGRELSLAMVAARLLDPQSKLATARGLDPETATTSLLETLQLEPATADDLYEAMDWLFARQGPIEDRLAKRHLSDGTLVLYDVTSTYFEGRCCPLARLGHSRDERSGNMQIVFGLLANAEGCPVAVEVFEGNTGDPQTVAAQISKLRKRFKLERVIVVGDRGMLTNARIREDLQPEGIDWITALRAPQIQALVSAGTLQLSLFDQRDLAEISHPDYPGERLIACRNPLLAAERARKREELLVATEKELTKIQSQTQRPRKPLRGKDAIGMAVGKVLGHYKVGKHFDIVIEDAGLRYQRKQTQIDAEAALDGIYVIRTSVKSEIASAEQTVFHYKSLSAVERAFRSIKSVDLKVRPIHHRLANRVRAHVFLCMLAYYVEWQMRRALAPILFDDHDRVAANAERKSIVAPAMRSSRALEKAHSKRTENGQTVHSFQTLMADLGTIAKNTVVMNHKSMQILTTPTALQQRAFDLLQVSLR
jgi:Transposase DDE domain